MNVALNEIEGAKKKIGKSPEQHPFEMRYEQTAPVDWETCTDVLEEGRDGSDYWRDGRPSYTQANIFAGVIDAESGAQCITGSA